MRMKPQFLIAAPHSGAGKTTVTLGILRALKDKELNVQPFKCGPDYLDPKLHSIASGKQSINLDRFMMDDIHIRELYQAYGESADVLITEGVMGLFDGAVKMEGSSADIARLLNIPIVLIVNAKAMAYSVAALLLGFKTLCKDIHIAGVIFNFVDHESHYLLLKAAAEDVGITALGYLPNNSAIQIPSRHLGLKTEEGIDLESAIELAAVHIKKYINLEELMRITAAPFVNSNLPVSVSLNKQPDKQGKLKTILIAKDAAFNFTYAENIKALSALGTIRYFSPLKDEILPVADLIYFPGGYPELHLEALSRNQMIKDQLFTYYSNGGKILAECGGMMYLGKSIADHQGNAYTMTGILAFSTSMQHKKLSIGYKKISIEGITLKGHEFHYSQFTEIPEVNTNIKVWNARNELLQLPVYHTNNILASYIHFYFGNDIGAIEKLLFT